MIGVAIPCYKNHIPLLKRCLDSIENQTRKPDFVVVSCSSSKQEDIPFYSSEDYSFPLQIVPHEERLNAAENRNIATDILIEKGCIFISFFDCDDEMHPQRIQAIEEGFQKYPETKILLHNFWILESELEEEFEKYDFFNYVQNKCYIGYNGSLEIISHPLAKIHHSQSTVLKDIFDKIRYNEEKQFERKEDTIFCVNIIELGIPSLYIFNPLSKYYPSGSYKNEL